MDCILFCLWNSKGGQASNGGMPPWTLLGAATAKQALRLRSVMYRRKNCQPFFPVVFFSRQLIRGLKSGPIDDRNLMYSCKFPTDEIMGAKIFNFAPKFFQNRDFQNQTLHFWTISGRHKKFPQMFRQPQFHGGQLLPVPVTMPLFVWVILAFRQFVNICL